MGKPSEPRIGETTRLPARPSVNYFRRRGALFGGAAVRLLLFGGTAVRHCRYGKAPRDIVFDDRLEVRRDIRAAQRHCLLAVDQDRGRRLGAATRPLHTTV